MNDDEAARHYDMLHAKLCDAHAENERLRARLARIEAWAARAVAAFEPAVGLLAQYPTPGRGAPATSEDEPAPHATGATGSVGGRAPSPLIGPRNPASGVSLARGGDAAETAGADTVGAGSPADAAADRLRGLAANWRHRARIHAHDPYAALLKSDADAVDAVLDDRERLAGQARAWLEIQRRADDAHALAQAVAKDDAGAYGRNVWHVALDAAVAARDEAARLRVLLASTAHGSTDAVAALTVERDRLRRALTAIEQRSAGESVFASPGTDCGCRRCLGDIAHDALATARAAPATAEPTRTAEE